MTAYPNLLVRMPLFRGITEHGAQRLLELGEVRQHGADEQLCKEGDSATSVLLIMSGKLRAYIERGTAELAVDDFGPGRILGDVAALCKIPRAVAVRALEPSAVLYWPNDAYRKILLDDPFLSHRLFAATMHMLIEQEKTLLERLIADQRLRAPC